MVKRNPHIAKLHGNYLFREIAKRKKLFLEKNPSVQLISLGIGDTTEPIPPSILEGFAKKVTSLGKLEEYTGYELEQGQFQLRQQIANIWYDNKIDPDEIFISDGSKCDLGRLQIMFGHNVKIAVQDPSYPVYVDTSVIVGQTHLYRSQRHYYEGIAYMSCLPSNHFFPDLNNIPKTDIIYFCSPNNPTGATTNKKQLTDLVEFAKKNHSIIVYDAAYAAYIQHDDLPRSIYEIEGAKDVAIELGSFSKLVGFTGVRLGWSIVPKTVFFEEGNRVYDDWNRINSTFFNGASNIAQAGGIAALTPQGLVEIKNLINFYMKNTQILKTTLLDLGCTVYGGDHAPYLWVSFSHQTSWQTFENLLEKAHIICTPGSGFGPAGEGFVRFSGFGHRCQIEEAAARLKKTISTSKII